MEGADDPNASECDALLTIPSVASRIGLKSARVLELIEADDLPARKERGEWRVRRRALDEWMSKHNWPIERWRPPEWPSYLELTPVRFAEIEAGVLALMDASLAFKLRSCIPMAVSEARLVVGFARPPKEWELDQVAALSHLPITIARISEDDLERALEEWDASIVEPETDVAAVDAPYTEAFRRFEEEQGLQPLEALMFSCLFELRIWGSHSGGLGGVRLARDHESGPFVADYFCDEVGAGEARATFAPAGGWASVWPRLRDEARLAELPAEENVNPRHGQLGGFRPYVQVLLDGRIQRRSYVSPDDRHTPSARRVQIVLYELRRALREGGARFRF